MILETREQLQQMEESEDTDKVEYTKKADLLKSLIELKGKFDGAYTQKLELTNDFKTLMVERVIASIQDEEHKKIIIKESAVETIPLPKTAPPETKKEEQDE